MRRLQTQTRRMLELLPMFPLNNGLVPGALLPLRMFESRYLTMIDACLDKHRQFGVVLISRGSEVGGGEQRYDVGTVATIMGIRTMDDGTTLTIARGSQRLRVSEWLEDDPYPQAMVERLHDPADYQFDPEQRKRLESAFARGLVLLGEIGVEVGSAMALPDDTAAAVFHAIALIPMETLDRQRILEIDDPGERLITAVAALGDTNELTALRLSSQ